MWELVELIGLPLTSLGIILGSSTLMYYHSGFNTLAFSAKNLKLRKLKLKNLKEKSEEKCPRCPSMH
jgi:hypothetical protein